MREGLGEGEAKNLRSLNEELRYDRLTHPTERQAREGDPDLRGREILIELVEDSLGDPRDLTSSRNVCFNGGVTNFNDRELSGNEERVERYEKNYENHT
jgi:hypothetical protein